jgi:biotin carboxyl carrier protein/GTPase SAR1 family protein
MNVAVRMPRIAAPGIRIVAESIAVQPGNTVKAGDPLMALRVGRLPVTFHSEVSGVVKDLRVHAADEIGPDRVVAWIESEKLPPIKPVGVSSPAAPIESAADPSRIAFRLPEELLSLRPPVVSKIHVRPGQRVQPGAPLIEVAVGPIRFVWAGSAEGVIADIAVHEGEELADGATVARIQSSEAPVRRADVVVPISTSRRLEIPDLTLIEFRRRTRALRDLVLAMGKLATAAGLSNSAEMLAAESARLLDPRFSVAVCGEFKRGKSTFLNALAGAEFLPNDVIPCTAFACRFQYAERMELVFVRADGVESRSPARSVAEIGAELDRLTRDPNSTVREAIIRLPLNLCRDGVDLIDTPGLNDSEAMNRVTMAVLPNVDAALLLLIPESPLSETERGFIQDHLLDRDVSRVLFVLNARDRVAPQQVPRMVNYLEGQITRILSKRDKAGVSEARVWAVSSRKELDNPGAEENGFRELRQQLDRLLFRQRGRLMIHQALQRIHRAASESLASIKLRLAQVAMSRESFQASLQEIARQVSITRLHANEIRRRLGEAQTQAESAAGSAAQHLHSELLALRESLPQQVSPDIIKAKTTEEVRAALSSLLQQSSGKLYQKALSAMLEKVRAIYEPVSAAARAFADEAEGAFVNLAGNVYHGAVGGQSTSMHTTGAFALQDQADFGGSFQVKIDLSLDAMSWLLLVQSTRSLFSGGEWASSLESHAVARLRENYGEEIERQVKARASVAILHGKLGEVVRRPFNNLLHRLNQEMKVLLDDTQSTLASLRSTAGGQAEAEQNRQWQSLHAQIEDLVRECESVVFSSPKESLVAEAAC